MLATMGKQTGQAVDSIESITDPEPAEAIEGPSRERIFEILSNYRRRCVLAYLQKEGGHSDLRTLSEQIAGWENDVDPELITSKQRMRVYTALRQSHLPKMDRYGIVEFDEQSGDVRLTEAAESVGEYMGERTDESTGLSTYFLGIGGLGLVLSAGLYLDLAVAGGIPDVVAGGVLSLVFALLGLEQLYRS